MVENDKTDVINSLKKINSCYNEVNNVKRKISSVNVPDTYERKIDVPEAPVAPQYSKGSFDNPVKYFNKLPKGFGIATGVQGFFFLISLSARKNAEPMTVKLCIFINTVFFILLGITCSFLIMNLLKKRQESKLYDEYLAVEKIKENRYSQEYNKYKILLDEYNKIVEQKEAEDKKIAKMLQKEKEKIQEEIRQNELVPLQEKLDKTNNNLISEEYFGDLDTIIGLLNSGRADSLKEALNLLEDMKYKERQLELEREKIEREEAAREEAARMEEKRYQEDIRRRERQREEDLRREEKLERQREDDLRREEEKNRSDALLQCRTCANHIGCWNYGKYPNCPNYRRR